MSYTPSSNPRKVSGAEQILLEATDDKPFSPTKSQLLGIAAQTLLSPSLCDDTMTFLKRQLERVHTKWRCYFRVFVVLEFILHLGAGASMLWAIDNLDLIKVFGQYDHRLETAAIKVQYAATQVLASLSDIQRLVRGRLDNRWRSRIPKLDGSSDLFLPLPTSSLDPPTAETQRFIDARLKLKQLRSQDPFANPPTSPYPLDSIFPGQPATKMAPINIWKNKSGTELGSGGPGPETSNSLSRLSKINSPTVPETLRFVKLSPTLLSDENSSPNLAPALSSSSKAVVVSKTSNSSAATASPSSHTLGEYFSLRENAATPFNDFHIQEIARLLGESGNLPWSTVPRLYTILRLIDQLSKIDEFINQGIIDVSLPLKSSDIGQILGSCYGQKFIEMQPLILTKAFDLRNGGHAHFARGDPFPFETKGTLGKGRFGSVDKVSSPLNGQEYARKRFQRKGLHKTQLQSFVNELGILKRIHHFHTVELVASYTDSKYFGIIMEPVADQDLDAFYRLVTIENTPLLRSFFGCLAGALNFLHESKVRHRDIKPQNILVKGPHVYLADFGISLDWEDLSRGTTTTNDPSKTPLYCAPEVARSEPRNESSDVWSLGCVFLEMLTVIKGHTIEAQRQFFKQSKDNARFYENILGIQKWVNLLQKIDSSWKSDSFVAGCILRMLKEKRDDRITAVQLFTELSTYQDLDRGRVNSLCGECCVSDTYSVSDSGSDGDPLADMAEP